MTTLNKGILDIKKKKKNIIQVDIDDSDDSDSDDSDSDELSYNLKDKMVFLKNPDKTQDVVRLDSESNARFSLPFRACIAGQVNSGKSTIAINIILQRQSKSPKFDEIHIVHGCQGTQEYNSINPTSIRHQIPHYTDFPNDKRILLVYDDIEFTKMNKDDTKKIVEMTRLGSHLGISCIFVNQLYTRILKQIRDNCDVHIMNRPLDLDSLNTVGRRIGLTKDKVNYIYDNLLPNFHDFLCVNYTKNAKYRYSKNLYEPIDISKIDFKKKK